MTTFEIFDKGFEFLDFFFASEMSKKCCRKTCHWVRIWITFLHSLRQQKMMIHSFIHCIIHCIIPSESAKSVRTGLRQFQFEATEYSEANKKLVLITSLLTQRLPDVRKMSDPALSGIDNNDDDGGTILAIGLAVIFVVSIVGTYLIVKIVDRFCRTEISEEHLARIIARLEQSEEQRSRRQKMFVNMTEEERRNVLEKALLRKVSAYIIYIYIHIHISTYTYRCLLYHTINLTEISYFTALLFH